MGLRGWRERQRRKAETAWNRKFMSQLPSLIGRADSETPIHVDSKAASEWGVLRKLLPTHTPLRARRHTHTPKPIYTHLHPTSITIIRGLTCTPYPPTLLLLLLAFNCYSQLVLYCNPCVCVCALQKSNRRLATLLGSTLPRTQSY